MGNNVTYVSIQVIGTLTVPTPTVSSNIANLSYVETTLSKYLPLSGGTMTGPLTITNTPQSSSDIITGAYTTSFAKQTVSLDKLYVTSDSLDQDTILNNEHINKTMEALNVDITNSYLSISGGKMSGRLFTVPPINSNDIANKAYADSINIFPQTTLPGYVLMVNNNANGFIYTSPNNPSINRLNVTNPINLNSNNLSIVNVTNINISLSASIAMTKFAPQIITSNLMTDISGHIIPTSNQWINKAGDTATNLSLTYTPVSGSHLVNKLYVDDLINNISVTPPITNSFGIANITNNNFSLTANISLTKFAALTPLSNVVTDNYGVLTTTNHTWVNVNGDSMSGILTLFGMPTLPTHAATKAYVTLQASNFLPTMGNYTDILGANAHGVLEFIPQSTLLSSISATSPLSVSSGVISIQNVTDANIINNANITFSKLSPLTISSNVVTNANGVLITTANQWVNQAGDTMSGTLSLNYTVTNSTDAVNQSYITNLITTRISATLPLIYNSGSLTLAAISNSNFGTNIPVSKLAILPVSSNVVTNSLGVLNTTTRQWVNKAGDSMTGTLTLNYIPSHNSDAINKSYVTARVPYTLASIGLPGQVLTSNGTGLVFTDSVVLPSYSINLANYMLGISPTNTLTFLPQVTLPALYGSAGSLVGIDVSGSSLTYISTTSVGAITASSPIVKTGTNISLDPILDANVSTTAGIALSKLAALTVSSNVVTDPFGVLITTTNTWINKVGDTIGGTLNLNYTPTNSTDAANYGYVINSIGNITANSPLSYSSGVISLGYVINSNFSTNIAMSKLSALTALSNVVTDGTGVLTTTSTLWINKAGDTISNNLNVNAPSGSSHALTKGFIDGLIPNALPNPIGAIGQCIGVNSLGALAYFPNYALPTIGATGKVLGIQNNALSYLNNYALPTIGSNGQVLGISSSALNYINYYPLPTIGSNGQVLGITAGTLGYINNYALPTGGVAGQMVGVNGGANGFTYITPNTLPATFGSVGQVLGVSGTNTLTYLPNYLLPTIGSSGQMLGVSGGLLTYVNGNTYPATMGTAGNVLGSNGTSIAYLPNYPPNNIAIAGQMVGIVNGQIGSIYNYMPMSTGYGTVVRVNASGTGAQSDNAVASRKFTPQFAKTTRGNASPGLIFIYGPNIYQCGINQGPFGTGTAASVVPCIVPMQITSGGNITGWLDVAYSGFNALALTNDGRVFQWGEFNSSRIGLQVVFPVGATSITYITMSSGYYQNNTIELFAIDTNGKAYSWGANGLGGLGLGNTTTYNTPQLVTALTGINIVNITVGTNSTTSAIAITNNGSIYTWGYNHYGGLGQGNTTDYNVPTLVSGSTNVTKAISICGKNTQFGRLTMYLTSSGAIYGAGYNGNGTLGTGNTTNSSTFVRETTNGTFTNIFANSTYSSSCFAVDTSGNLHVTGYNNDYCFGNGTAHQAIVNSFANSTTLNAAGFQGKMNPVAGGVTPKVVSGGDIYFGYTETYVLDNTGTLWAAGQNTSGQAGINLSLNSNSCIQTFKQCLVPNNQKVLDVIAIGYINSNQGAAIIMEDNTIASCGINNNGALGNETSPSGTAIPFFRYLIGFGP